MGKIFSLAARIVLSIILVLMTISFISLQSAFQHLNEDNFDEIISETVVEILERQLENRSGEMEELDFEEVYISFIDECGEKDTIFVEEVELEMSCGEIEESGPEGLEELFKKRLKEKVEDELEKQLVGKKGISDADSFFEGIRTALIVLGFISIALIIVIVTLSVPKYKAANTLGIVGLVSGLPFIFVKGLNVAATYIDLNVLSNLANDISNSLFINFLIVFIVGSILLAIGLPRRPKEKSVKSRKVLQNKR